MMGNIKMRGVLRVLTGVAMLAMTSGFAMPAFSSAMPVKPASASVSTSAQWMPLRVPQRSLYAVNPELMSPFATFGSVSNPADGIGLYAGLNFDLADVLNGYAMGQSAILPGSSDSAFLFADGVSYTGVQMMLADGVRFNFGQAFADHYTGHRYMGLGGLPQGAGDPDTTGTLVSSLNWNFAKWGGISLTGSQTQVRDAALGNAASAMDLARMASLGVSAHVGFGDGWVTSVSYRQASLKLSLNPGFDTGNPVLHRESFGFAVAKQGLFGHDALGLSLSRPSGDFSSAPHLPRDMQFQFYGRDKLFAGKSAQETDIGLGYVTSFLDGPIALQANASYQLNSMGENKDSLTFMSRAKIKF